jgi:hypothetical protein
MVTERHNPARRQMLGETRLLSEWLAENYWGREWRLQYRVGPDPKVVAEQNLDAEATNYVRSFNRKVDALVLPPPETLLIEATMYRSTEKLGRLLEYGVLLQATPEYAKWRAHPLQLLLLTAQHDPLTQAIVERAGMRYVHWEPPWFAEWAALYPHRMRRASNVGLGDVPDRLAGASALRTLLFPAGDPGQTRENATDG